MPNDNKLVTLADLGEAYNDLDSRKKEVQTAVTDPTASGTAVAFIDSISQDVQGVITPTKKTVATATQSSDGLMSATDKTKLDGIEIGAQVNTITGVKGSEEADYRTGNVSISAENVGALVSDFSELDPVGTFTGNERIPLYLNGENYSTDMQTLLSSAAFRYNYTNTSVSDVQGMLDIFNRIPTETGVTGKMWCETRGPFTAFAYTGRQYGVVVYFRYDGVIRVMSVSGGMPTYYSK